MNNKEFTDRSTPVTQTLPNSLFVFYQAYARKHGFKNVQEAINQVLRNHKETVQRETGFRTDL